MGKLNVEWLFFDVGSTIVDERIAYDHRMREIANLAKTSYSSVYKTAMDFYKQNKRGNRKMQNNQNYIQWIRSKVGHEKIILIFAGGCIFNDKGEILLQRRGRGKWGFPGGAIELGETPQMAAIRKKL